MVWCFILSILFCTIDEQKWSQLTISKIAKYYFVILKIRWQLKYLRDFGVLYEVEVFDCLFYKKYPSAVKYLEAESWPLALTHKLIYLAAHKKILRLVVDIFETI